jgi:hypothetical protein
VDVPDLLLTRIEAGLRKPYLRQSETHGGCTFELAADSLEGVYQICLVMKLRRYSSTLQDCMACEHLPKSRGEAQNNRLSASAHGSCQARLFL